MKCQIQPYWIQIRIHSFEKWAIQKWFDWLFVDSRSLISNRSLKRQRRLGISGYYTIYYHLFTYSLYKNYFYISNLQNLCLTSSIFIVPETKQWKCHYFWSVNFDFSQFHDLNWINVDEWRSNSDPKDDFRQYFSLIDSYHVVTSIESVAEGLTWAIKLDWMRSTWFHWKAFQISVKFPSNFHQLCTNWIEQLEIHFDLKHGNLLVDILDLSIDLRWLVRFKNWNPEYRIDDDSKPFLAVDGRKGTETEWNNYYIIEEMCIFRTWSMGKINGNVDDDKFTEMRFQDE